MNRIKGSNYRAIARAYEYRMDEEMDKALSDERTQEQIDRDNEAIADAQIEKYLQDENKY